MKRPGYSRGIDVYQRSVLPVVFANAVNVFEFAHGRPPDLVNLPATADYFFKMKFFDLVPVIPNPASKLLCRGFIPPELSDVVRVPRRLWVSKEPALPDDASLPRGSYWLKLEYGNAGHLKLDWPVSLEQRREIEELLAIRMKQKFGIADGEWWYGLGSQRAFLEEDLSEFIESGQELKLFIREGRFAVGYRVSYVLENGIKRNSLCLFDMECNPIAGTLRLGKSNPDYHVLPFQRPPHLLRTLEYASAIGRRFKLIRVDMILGRDGSVYLGELTLCTGNATAIFSPSSLEDFMRANLFEVPAPPRLA